MQTFLSHGDACTRVEAEALELATHGARGSDEDAPLQVYNDMLDSLGENISHYTPLRLCMCHHSQKNSMRKPSNSNLLSFASLQLHLALRKLPTLYLVILPFQRPQMLHVRRFWACSQHVYQLFGHECPTWRWRKI